jgi:hypothetical protein
LVHRCVLEKVENWGYRITVTGLKILSIFNKSTTTTTTKNVNTTTTQQQHVVNMKNEQKQRLNIPECFYKKYCHIKTALKKSVYNHETSKLCSSDTSQCVHFNLDNFSSRQKVQISI